MHPTTDIRAFIRSNSTQLRDLTFYICRDYNYTDSYEDVIQDVYVRMIASKFIENYKEENGKLSSYVYPLIKNVVINKIKKNKKHRNSLSNIFLNDCNIDEEKLDPRYYTRILNNYNELEPELRGFEEYLIKKNRNVKFSLLRRKNKGSSEEECSLLSVFRYFYSGYTAREIAIIYGVTPMAVCNIKYKLADMMRKYGIETGARFKKYD